MEAVYLAVSEEELGALGPLSLLGPHWTTAPRLADGRRLLRFRVLPDGAGPGLTLDEARELALAPTEAP